jgi:uncharacterized protein
MEHAFQPDPSAPDSATPPVPWGWRDLGWVMALMIFGIGFVVGGLSLLRNSPLAPTLDDSAGLVSPLIFVGTLAIYALLVVAVLGFSGGRYRGGWRALGLNLPSASWIVLVPAVFVLQLIAFVTVNLLLMLTLSQFGIAFENPQIGALLGEERAGELMGEGEGGGAAEAGEGEGGGAAEEAEGEVPALPPLSIGEYLMLMVLVAVAAPLAEELLFRGMLYPLLRRNMGVVAAVALSAALFSAVHVVPILLPALFVIGVVLAIVRERSGSLWPCIALHALQNGGVVTLLFVLSRLDLQGMG